MPIEGHPVTDYVDVTPPLDSHDSAIAAVREWAIEHGRDPDDVVRVVVVNRWQLRSPETHEFVGHKWVGRVPKRMVDRQSCADRAKGAPNCRGARVAAARVTCTSVAGVGVKGDPAIVSGCTNAAKTGGKGKQVDVEPRNTNDSIGTITWAGKHGTTIVRINQGGFDKQSQPPKGWFAGWEGGKVTGGTGPAHTVIPNGRTMKVHICGKPKTSFAQLAKGPNSSFEAESGDSTLPPVRREARRRTRSQRLALDDVTAREPADAHAPGVVCGRVAGRRTVVLPKLAALFCRARYTAAGAVAR